MDLISGALSLGGGLLSNWQTDRRQASAQQFNAQQAQAQMDFQERMRNTAYQATMKDMRKAGLNPILAYQRGPTSSPTGAMASTSYTPAADVVSPAVASARASSRVNAEIENMQETNRNLKTQNQLLNAQVGQVGASTAKTIAETAVTTEMLKEAQRKGKLGEIDKAFYDSTFGRIMRNLGLALGEANPLTRVAPRPHIIVRPQD